MEKLRIDDPVGASPIHAGCGAFGFLCGAFFARRENVVLFYSLNVTATSYVPYGLFLGGGWEQVGIHVLTIIVVAIYVTIFALIMFILIRQTIGLRVSNQEEAKGLDIVMGGAAYQIDNANVSKVDYCKMLTNCRWDLAKLILKQPVQVVPEELFKLHQFSVYIILTFFNKTNNFEHVQRI